MDFDKTSFSVDWFTPGDRCAAKRLSFPKSARISLDDLVSESPWSICFSPIDEPVPQPRSQPIVHTPPYEKPCAPTDPPPSPLSPTHRTPSPMPDQKNTKTSKDSRPDWRSRASPALLAVADDCAACGVDMDVSCLDTLDDHLLVSPMDCLIDQCWERAVYEEVFAPMPVVYTETRPRAHSFKCNYEHALPLFPTKDYLGSFERSRPLAAKISLPLEKFPHFLSTPSFEPYDTTSYFQEKPVADVDFLYTDAGRPLHLPSQAITTPRRSKKRDDTLTPPSVESFSPIRPSKPSLESSKSSQTLRVLSDAYSSLTRSRRKSPF